MGGGATLCAGWSDAHPLMNEEEKSFGFCLHDKAANTVYGTIQRLTCASLHKVPEYGYCL
ncbi:hypothetical protein KY285_014621 [Solanum tuberosum]|nr:hypothetical protein KY284_014586 [Solanum tuberosum]KAH0718590.1 hypothetical protein KY285_014621 [Solanum tuberosum]